MPTPRKPWVEIAATEYYNLINDIETLIYLSKTLFEKAVFGRHNPVLLEKIVAIIPVKLTSFRQQARLANSKRGRQHGKRYPKWVVIALEEGLAITRTVELSLSHLETAYQSDDWNTIEIATTDIYNNILEIQEYFLSGPPPVTVDKVSNITEAFWKKWGTSYE